jgi:hypothetical protein
MPYLSDNHLKPPLSAIFYYFPKKNIRNGSVFKKFIKSQHKGNMVASHFYALLFALARSAPGRLCRECVVPMLRLLLPAASNSKKPLSRQCRRGAGRYGSAWRVPTYSTKLKSPISAPGNNALAARRSP